MASIAWHCTVTLLYYNCNHVVLLIIPVPMEKPSNPLHYINEVLITCIVCWYSSHSNIYKKHAFLFLVATLHICLCKRFHCTILHYTSIYDIQNSIFCYDRLPRVQLAVIQYNTNFNRGRNIPKHTQTPNPFQAINQQITFFSTHRRILRYRSIPPWQT